jgi:L-rhamnose isomerase/sugar isomerase
MHEVNVGGGFDIGTPVSYVLDQCHNIEAKIPGQIRSIMNVQEAVAKAVLVDQNALKAAQKSGDVLAANEVLMDAFNTDVRPIIREWREAKGIDGEPMKAYAKSGYAEKIAAERIGGNQAGWGA